MTRLCVGCSEALYGQLLGPFLDDPTNLFVISSDFCHWGQRFGFTYCNVQEHVSCVRLLTLLMFMVHGWHSCIRRESLLQGSISRSIQWLDKVAMKIIEEVWLTTSIWCHMLLA